MQSNELLLFLKGSGSTCFLLHVMLLIALGRSLSFNRNDRQALSRISTQGCHNNNARTANLSNFRYYSTSGRN